MKFRFLLVGGTKRWKAGRRAGCVWVLVGSLGKPEQGYLVGVGGGVGVGEKAGIGRLG